MDGSPPRLHSEEQFCPGWISTTLRAWDLHGLVGIWLLTFYIGCTLDDRMCVLLVLFDVACFEMFSTVFGRVCYAQTLKLPRQYVWASLLLKLVCEVVFKWSFFSIAAISRTSKTPVGEVLPVYYWSMSRTWTKRCVSTSSFTLFSNDSFQMTWLNGSWSWQSIRLHLKEEGIVLIQCKPLVQRSSYGFLNI